MSEPMLCLITNVCIETPFGIMELQHMECVDSLYTPAELQQWVWEHRN